MKAIFTGAAAVVLCGAAPGCGSPAESYCHKVCDCRRCDQTGLGSCPQTMNDLRTEAAEAGCGSQFDEALACAAAAQITCEGRRAEAEACRAEAEALAECTGGHPIFVASACDIALDEIIAKSEECGIDESYLEVLSCTAELEAQWICLAPCVEQTSCGGLTNEDPVAAESYMQCASDC
jgi:hypothetical protein